MSANKGGVVLIVGQLAAPVAERLGLSIWDIEFVKEGASWFLRIYIDKEGGVAIEDCEAFSRAVEGPIDEADPISQNYYLEVSSPGIERELKKDEHFEKMMGSRVRINLIRPDENGAREMTGELAAYKDGIVSLATPQGVVDWVRRRGPWLRPSG